MTYTATCNMHGPVEHHAQTGACVLCTRARKRAWGRRHPEQPARKERRRRSRGAYTYRRECPEHGLTDYYLSCHTCVECQRENTRAWLRANESRARANREAWHLMPRGRECGSCGRTDGPQPNGKPLRFATVHRCARCYQRERKALLRSRGLA